MWDPYELLALYQAGVNYGMELQKTLDDTPPEDGKPPRQPDDPTKFDLPMRLHYENTLSRIRLKRKESR